MSVPAMVSPNAIPRFLDSIRKSGTPNKVDGNYLKSLGFKNSNDMALITLFRTLGFLDSNGQPTDTYRHYKGASAEEAKRVLGTAIKGCYPGLFELYPDAYRKDDEALTNWMRANTDKSETVQARALRTFKALRDTASFDEATPPLEDAPHVSPLMPNDNSQGAHVSNRIQHTNTQKAPDVTINITLQIEATKDASIYDKFFASMKRHLFSDES